jgi:GNAT superfamily N-acetyltransferase
VIRFRHANEGDAPAIAELHVASWRAAYRGVLPPRFLRRMDAGRLETSWQRRIRRSTRAPEVHVLDHDDTIIGFAQIGPCRHDRDMIQFAGEVYMLYLRPDRIGAGFGGMLLRGALDELERRGYPWVVIWVLSANREAQRFYHHFGLGPDGAHRRDWFDDRAVNVVRYARVLNPVIDYERLLGKVSR